MNRYGLTIWATSHCNESVLIQYKEIDEKDGSPVLISYPIIEIDYEDMYIKNNKTDVICYFHNPVQFEILTEDIKYYVIKNDIDKLNKTVRQYIGDIIYVIKEPVLSKEIEDFTKYLKDKGYSTGEINKSKRILRHLLKLGVNQTFSTDEVKYLLYNQGLKRNTVVSYITTFNRYLDYINFVGDNYEKNNSE